MTIPRITYRRLGGGAYRAVVVEYPEGRTARLHVLGEVRRDEWGQWWVDRQVEGRCGWGNFDSRAEAGESLWDDWAADHLPIVARLYGRTPETL